MIGDCASDPPLGATLRALACARPDDVLLGLAALAKAGDPLRVVVRHFDAEAALREAVARLDAKVEILRLPDAWPPAVNGPDARALVAASPKVRQNAAARFVTVAGAVREPAVLPLREEVTLAQLVARAGGPLDDDWLPVVEHRVRARDESWDGEPLVLVLPARHPIVRRLKTPLVDQLARVMSACEGCRICSEACAHLQPHEVVWTLASLRDDGVRPLAALECTGCGLCDAMCPSALSPRALVVEVRDRLRAAGATSNASTNANANANASGLDVKLLIQRLGLADYDREPARKL
jgi:Na+-translocating ferredoxin:NAD+ oxidoreductase RnfC subunit